MERKAGRVVLILNTNKTKVVCLTGHRTFLICINGQNIEGFDQVVYIGSVVSGGSGTKLDSLEAQAMLDLPSLFCLKFANAVTSAPTSSVPPLIERQPIGFIL